MGNWLSGWSSDGSSGYSSGWSPGGSSGVPSGPAHELEESIQANLQPNEKCLKQIGVTSVPSHKLEEYIQANLKPYEESLKQIDQEVDVICCWLLIKDFPVTRVAKVRLRVGARTLDPRRVLCPHRWRCSVLFHARPRGLHFKSFPLRTDSAGAQAAARSSSAWMHDSRQQGVLPLCASVS